MSALFDESSQRDARRHSRNSALIGVKFRRKGEAWFMTKVTDMSPAGFRLLSFVKLRVGMEVWVMFPGFDGRKARVIWVANHEAGCTFESPLHPAIYDHIVRTSEPAIRH
jgi:hypothetical protein